MFCRTRRDYYDIDDVDEQVFITKNQYQLCNMVIPCVVFVGIMYCMSYLI